VPAGLGQAGQNDVDDILGHVVLTERDKILVAVQL